MLVIFSAYVCWHSCSTLIVRLIIIFFSLGFFWHLIWLCHVSLQQIIWSSALWEYLKNRFNHLAYSFKSSNFMCLILRLDYQHALLVLWSNSTSSFSTTAGKIFHSWILSSSTRVIWFPSIFTSSKLVHMACQQACLLV